MSKKSVNFMFQKNVEFENFYLCKMGIEMMWRIDKKAIDFMLQKIVHSTGISCNFDN